MDKTAIVYPSFKMLVQLLDQPDTVTIKTPH